jgi:lysophospholipase L1-like esterase
MGIAYRCYLWCAYSVAPTDFSNQVDPCQVHYPELSKRGILQSRRSESEFSILLLGGSVAEQTASRLQEKLSEISSCPVRVHNAAISAHTTQDSLNKLQCLREQGAEFDHIIVYHGINDVRMNCIASDDFRKDYAHCQWYASFNRRKLQRRISARETLVNSWGQLIGLGEPDSEHVAFGAEIKTGPAFQAHIEAILSLAGQDNTPVTLMTFATYFPVGYSREAFDGKKLGYSAGQFSLPIELWGTPENVKRGVEVHNKVLRRLAMDRPELEFIDMAEVLTDIASFCDVCHLSPAGIDEFSTVVADRLQKSKISEPPRHQ